MIVDDFGCTIKLYILLTAGAYMHRDAGGAVIPPSNKKANLKNVNKKGQN